jgi:hypothetical protein
MGCSWFNSHFAAGALGDSIRFGIFVVYQIHPGTWSLNNTLIGFGPKQAIITQSEIPNKNFPHVKKIKYNKILTYIL